MMASTTLETLQLLDARLDRLAYFLSLDGDDKSDAAGTDVAIDVRLGSLESRLTDLVKDNPTAKEVLELRRPSHRVHTKCTTTFD